MMDTWWFLKEKEIPAWVLEIEAPQWVDDCEGRFLGPYTIQEAIDHKRSHDCHGRLMNDPRGWETAREVAKRLDIPR